jgi:hypothetical protein
MHLAHNLGLPVANLKHAVLGPLTKKSSQKQMQLAIVICTHHGQQTLPWCMIISKQVMHVHHVVRQVHMHAKPKNGSV